MVKIDAEPVNYADLQLCHSDKHIALIQSCSEDKKKGEALKPHQNMSQFTSDTYENKFTADAAALACGSTVEAVA